MGFSRQEYGSELPFPSPGYLPNPGMEPGSPVLQVDSLKQYFQFQFSRSVKSNSLRPHGARQASLSITNGWSLPKPMSIESVMPSNHLILCRPLLRLPSISPSIRVFSNESALCNTVVFYC